MGPPPCADGIFESTPLSFDASRPVKSVHEEEEKGSASLCLSSTEQLAHGGMVGSGAQSRNVRVCPERLSCFRRAIVGRHCYCSGGPEGPGMTAAHPGWPALEGAVRRTDAIFSQMLRFSIVTFFKNTDEFNYQKLFSHSQQWSGLTSNEGSGMSDPAWLSKLLEEGLKDRSPW